ncbi:MAG: hypothetical protein A2126_01825 [Candidatus Woykebacteria bacterium GWB1_45_5]|uniref:Glycosyltransferase 2-like domain-containing protein n=2 Tax=Candidatus Woykeibacteriota TaxID=1817899 RepID=A0A1G1W261_9BACT|nr:MAG: hypothetical protein A2113_03915 [Candidatus Woykebacteria bacterium GWA1_44_8]OGY23037.1 MAG: hypothetical protein A2126_01825 [Candidatus Woykebacteria bacterium GWB1_45_5]
MDKITFIIVTWNSSGTIDGCLKRLEKLKVEVWVVDNNSSDDTVSKVKEYPQVKLIKNKSNLGFATANNVVLKKVISEFVFLLNPDAQLVGAALAEMIKFMEKNKDVGILGPKLLNPDGSLQREMTPFPGLLDQILILLRLHRLPWFRNLVYPNYDYNKTQEAPHLMGSALLVRKEVFEKVGAFDENFFLWFEETDLEKRAKEAGFKIIYYPKAQVKHLRSTSIKKINPLKRQAIWNKSLRYYFKKHKSRLEQLILEPFIYISFLPALLLVVKEKIRLRT